MQCYIYVCVDVYLQRELYVRVRKFFFNFSKLKINYFFSFERGVFGDYFGVIIKYICIYLSIYINHAIISFSILCFCWFRNQVQLTVNILVTLVAFLFKMVKEFELLQLVSGIEKSSSLFSRKYLFQIYLVFFTL